MSQTCNHIAASLYRVGAAVRSGLTNSSCTSKPNELLPGSRAVVDIPAKIMELEFEREDLGTRDKNRDLCQKNLNKLTIPYELVQNNL